VRQRDLGTERRFAVACIMPWPKAILRGAGALEEAWPPQQLRQSRARCDPLSKPGTLRQPIFIPTLRIARRSLGGSKTQVLSRARLVR
jgi:hypothetical protein